MRSCVKKPIKILMGNCFVKSNVVMLVMTIFALQVTYAQDSEAKNVPISPRYGEADTKYMINHFLPTINLLFYINGG